MNKIKKERVIGYIKPLHTYIQFRDVCYNFSTLGEKMDMMEERLLKLMIEVHREGSVALWTDKHLRIIQCAAPVTTVMRRTSEESQLVTA